jgi:hypothetical protein
MIGQKLLSKVNQNLANRNQANPNEANHDQSNQVQLKLETIVDDEGSITPLIVLYFIVIMA